jgi:ribonuclease G
MGREILASVDGVEIRVAVLEDGALAGIAVERGAPLAGNVYKGRVASVLPGMEAAFVDIGLDRNAFLPLADIRSERVGGEELEDPIGRGGIAERLRVGQEILVQVTKEPRGSKGARATTYIALPGHYVVLMPTVSGIGVSRRIEDAHERKRLRGLGDRLRPPRGGRDRDRMGLIVRTAADGVSERALADDVRFLVRLWEGITARGKTARAPALLYQDLGLVGRAVRDLFTGEVDRFLIDSPKEFEGVREILAGFPNARPERVELYQGAKPLFEAYGVDREIERALHRKVWLRSGGYLVFDRTEAATVIDVNTGKYVGKTDQPSTILRTNLEAAAEVARQLRLRDIGGIILVDFIDMDSEKHRRRVVAALEEAVRADRTKTNVIDLTALGLVELTRKRVYQNLDEIMRMPCPYCEGRGRVLSPQSVAIRVRRDIERAARTARGRYIIAHVHPDVAAALESARPPLDALGSGGGKSVVVRPVPGVHVERASVLAGDSLDAVERERAAGNGKGAAMAWLGPLPQPETAGDGDDGDADRPPRPGRAAGARGVVSRLRAWLGRRSRAKRAREAREARHSTPVETAVPRVAGRAGRADAR